MVEILAVILGLVVGGYLGRKAQRKIWLLDRPYKERLTESRRERAHA